MQTFMPYHNDVQTAHCLDYKRLGKQRVEAYQILKCLLIKPSRWINHPAVKMWKGYEYHLAMYGFTMSVTWIARGYNDSLKQFFIEIGRKTKDQKDNDPKWITEEFCLSHQSNLVRKFPEHYRKYFPDVPDNLPYIWPTNKS